MRKLMIESKRPAAGVLAVLSPYDGRELEQIATSGVDHVEDALTAAHALFKDRDSWFDIDSVNGIQKGLMPLYLKTSTGEIDKSAAYEVLSVDGKTDIIGHKGENDLFFMVDDPAVWSELGVLKK